MIVKLRNFVICFLCVFLFSCAGGPTHDSVKGRLAYVDVSSGVEADFKNAVVLMQKEEYEQAISVLKTVIDREQRLPAPYVNLAMAYNKLDKTTLAEENFVKALKLDIGHPVANNELGLLYRKAGKFNESRAVYENAIKYNPEYLPAKRNLGVLCDLYMHDFECALKQFEDYLELNPDDKTVTIWVADVKRRF